MILERTFRCCILGALALAATALAHPAADELVAALDAQLAERPADAALWVARAHVGRDLGRTAQALADLDRAAALGAEPAEIARTRGLVWLDAGDAAAAERALDQALALRPGDPRTLVARARARRLAGRPAEAAADFAAARLAGQIPDPGWVDEEVALWRAAGRPAQALAVVTEAADRLGALPSLVDAAVELELAAGRAEAALGWIDRGLATGDRATGLARRAELELLLGREAAAADDYLAAWTTLAQRPAHRRGTRAFDELASRLRLALVALGQPDPGAALCLSPTAPARSLR